MVSKTIIGTAAGLIVGLVIGFWGANYLNRGNDEASAGLQLPNSTVNAPAAPNQAPNQNGTIADVQKTLDQAQSNPNDPLAQMEAGDLYLQIERYDEALQFYTKAATINPKSFDANANIGQVYFITKKYEQAAEYYEKALAIDGGHVGVRSDLGLTYFRREPPDTPRAIEEYRKALKIDPNHEPALQNLYVALGEQGDKTGQAKIGDVLRKVNPKNTALTQ